MAGSEGPTNVARARGRAVTAIVLTAAIVAIGLTLWPYAFDALGTTFLVERNAAKLGSIAVGWLFLLTGVFAWWRGSGARLALLLGGPGAALYVTTMVTTGVPLLWTTAHAFERLFAVAIIHLLLAYPSGRLGWWLPRALVAGGWLVVVVRGVIGTLFLLPSDGGCTTCPASLNLLLVEHDPDFVHRVLEGVSNPVALAVLVATAVLLSLRAWRASPATRRAVVPVLAPGTLWCVAFLAYAATHVVEGSGPYGMPGRRFAAITGLMVMTMAAIPAGHLVRAREERRRRHRASDLLRTLGEGPAATAPGAPPGPSTLSPGKALALGGVSGAAMFIALVLSPSLADPLGTGRPSLLRAVVLLTLVGAYVLVGLAESWRGRTARAGPAFVALGAMLALSMLVVTRVPVLYTLGLVTLPWIMPLLAGLFLAYPNDRLAGRTAWVLTGLAGVAAVLIGVVLRLFLDPHRNGCVDCQPGLNLLLVRADNEAVHRIAATAGAVIAVAFVVTSGVLVWRWWQATPNRRRVLGPMTAASVLFSAATLVYLSRLATARSNFQPPITGPANGAEFFSAALLGVPLMFLLGNTLERRRRDRIGALVTQVAAPVGGDALVLALRRVLDDPSLELGVATDSGFVTADGTPMQLPDAADPRRAVTVLGAADDAVGVIVHDRALLADREVLQPVVAATTLALHNRRLSNALADRLAEVQASRARLVAASDEARRRIERDIHDGAQQRLVVLALGLRSAESALGDRAPDVADHLRSLSDDVATALRELRDLARGLYPPVLMDQGLPAALQALARRPGIRLTLDVDVPQRPAASAEAAAYFVVNEAVTNAAKHALADQVRITVRSVSGVLHVHVADDGIGGADANGAGLRGLQDRVEALDGSFRVDSDPGAGTTIIATIPCGESGEVPVPSRDGIPI